MDAFRKDKFTGYVPMHGYGAANYTNKWTTLNIRPTKGKGGTVRWLLMEEPKVLNPCTASSAYEWEVLGRVYDGLMEVHPETMEDIPWMAKSWEVGTWEPEPGEIGTVITWHLEEGIKWQDTTPSHPEISSSPSSTYVITRFRGTSPTSSISSRLRPP